MWLILRGYFVFIPPIKNALNQVFNVMVDVHCTVTPAIAIAKLISVKNARASVSMISY